MLFILIGALCAILVTSCASIGGGKSDGGFGKGTLATGEWMVYNDENDGGNSTVTITTAEEVIDGQTVTTYTVKGNVTTKFIYGFAGWGLNHDEKTLELLKTAKAFSFKFLSPDGKRYAFKYKTSDIKDFCYHEWRFTTEPGVAEEVFIETRMLMQPSWGETKRLKPENCIGVEWQTHESWRKDPNNNPFEIKIWDFKIYN